MKSIVNLSDIPLTAIANVVDYLEADEEKDYDSHGGRKHIVHSVRRLKKFLYTINPDNDPLERMRIKWIERMDHEQERNMRKVWGGVVADNNSEQSP